MKRLINDKLYEWSKSDNNAPLFVVGARQIGKTYSVMHLAENYYKDKYIYINFLDKDEYYKLLKDKTNPNDIIQTIRLISRKNIDESWLIIFDEIQEVEDLKTSLKLFVEYNLKYKIICLGSYLGNMLNDKSSFPVGKINRIELFPMNFHEFLYATKYDHLIENIKESIATNKPIDGPIHEKLNSLLYDFMIIGGMPRVLYNYINNNNLLETMENKRSLINDYKTDITKYISSNNDKLKCQTLYDNIPVFLSKENNKFKLSSMDKTARYLNYSNAIESLLATKIIYKINNVKTISPPLKMKVNESEFKIYYNDCGFLSANFNINQDILINSEEYKDIRGSIAENYILSELVQKIGVSNINYYSFRDSSNNMYEIDFCIENNKGQSIPIEIKFGDDNFKTKSLNKLLLNNESIKVSIVFSSKNFHYDSDRKIYYIPMYAVGFLNFIDNRIILE